MNVFLLAMLPGTVLPIQITPTSSFLSGVVNYENNVDRLVSKAQYGILEFIQ